MRGERQYDPQEILLFSLLLNSVARLEQRLGNDKTARQYIVWFQIGSDSIRL